LIAKKEGDGYEFDGEEQLLYQGNDLEKLKKLIKSYSD
jgi:hypothetical protein